MKQENKKPLYKVLNEQRTQGEIVVENHGQFDNGRSLMVNGKCITSTFGQNASESEIEANAQYTALAVNNLAELASVLENFLAGLDDPVKPIGEIVHDTKIRAKIALSRIE